MTNPLYVFLHSTIAIIKDSTQDTQPASSMIVGLAMILVSGGYVTRISISDVDMHNCCVDTPVIR